MSRKTAFLLLAVLILLPAIIITPKTNAASPTVSISKIHNITEQDTTFLVNITVSDVSDLNMWIINITWDPTVIKISEGDPNGTEPRYKEGTKYNIYEGPFLEEAAEEANQTTYFGVRDVDNDNGQILRISCAFPGRFSISGSGVLARINFTLVNKGTTEIRITGPSIAFPGKSLLQDSNGNEIPHEDSDGIVSDQPPPSSAIWSELWFQITIIAIVVVVLAIAYIAYKKTRKPAE